MPPIVVYGLVVCTSPENNSCFRAIFFRPFPTPPPLRGVKGQGATPWAPWAHPLTPLDPVVGSPRRRASPQGWPVAMSSIPPGPGAPRTWTQSCGLQGGRSGPSPLTPLPASKPAQEPNTKPLRPNGRPATPHHIPFVKKTSFQAQEAGSEAGEGLREGEPPAGRGRT